MIIPPKNECTEEYLPNVVATRFIFKVDFTHRCLNIYIYGNDWPGPAKQKKNNFIWLHLEIER